MKNKYFLIIFNCFDKRHIGWLAGTEGVAVYIICSSTCIDNKH